MSPDYGFPDGTHVHLSTGIKQALVDTGHSTPAVIAGKIRRPVDAGKILQEGKADVIGLSRLLLCDPDWPNRAREDRDGDIVLCLACTWCLDAVERYEKVKVESRQVV